MFVGAKSSTAIDGGASYCTRGDGVGGGALALDVLAVEEGRSCICCPPPDVTCMPFAEGMASTLASLLVERLTCEAGSAFDVTELLWASALGTLYSPAVVVVVCPSPFV